MADDLDRFLDGVVDEGRQKDAAAASLAVAADQGSPDETAQNYQLANEFAATTGGVPPSPSMVKQYKPVFQQEVDLARTKKQLAQAPKLARWLRNPNNTALAKDDVQGLSALESAMVVPRAVASGVLQVDEGGWGYVSALAKAAGLDGVSEYALGEAKTAKAFDDNVLGPKPANWLGQQVQGASESLGMMVPGAVASIATGGAATPGVLASWLAPGVLTQGGQSSAQALEAGKSGTTALAYGTMDMIAEAAFERIPMSKFLGDLSKGTGFIPMLTQNLLREVPTEVATTVAQNLDQWIYMNPDKTAGDWIREQPAAIRDTIAQTVLMSTGLVSGAHGMRAVGKYLARKHSADGGRAAGAMIGKIAEAAKGSKLRDRAPETFSEFVGDTAKDTPAESLYVPADTFNQFVSSIDLDPYELAGRLTGLSRSELDAQANATGFLKVPMATYAKEIPGSELEDFFTENATTDPAGMTASEAANMESETAQREMVEEMQNAWAEDQKWRDADARVYDEMVSRLRAAGLGTNEAVANAHQITAFYRTQAQRAGQDPDEYLAAHPLPEVAGIDHTGPQYRAVDELTRLLAAARAGAGVERKSTPLADFVAKRGGIDDEEGELSGRDIGAPMRPGQHRVANAVERGERARPEHGLDAMAHAAFEADLLPETLTVSAYRDAMANGTEAPDLRQDLIDTLVAEHAGEGEKSEEAQAIERLEARLSQEGLSLDSSDAEIRAALGETFNQAERSSWFAKADKLWRHGLQRVFSGKARDLDTISMGQPGPVLRAVGLKNKQLVMSVGKLRKVMREHPEVTKEVAETLFRGINDPQYVLKSATEGNSILSVPVQLSDGRVFVVPIRSDVAGGQGGTVNLIASAYLKDDPEWLDREIHSGRLVYARDGIGAGDRANLSGSNSQRVQPNPAGRILPRKKNVLTRKDVFKGENSDPFNENSGETFNQSTFNKGGRQAPVTLVPSDTPVPVLDLHDLPDLDRDEAIAAMKEQKGDFETATGQRVRMTSNATRKAFSGYANEIKRGLAPYLGEILQNTVVYGEEPGIGKETNPVLYGVAHVRIDGEDTAVRLVLKTMDDGTLRLYQFEGLEVAQDGENRQTIAARRPEASSQPIPLSVKRSASAPSSVGELVRIFNEYPEGEWSLYQGEERPNASITFRPSGVPLIQLFAGRNVSSVQHEFGHLFLTYLQNDARGGSQAAQSEMDILNQWWIDNAEAVAKEATGHADGQAISEDDVFDAIASGTAGDAQKDQAIRIAMQEHFARAYEGYLMEGKAPSLRLSEVFSRISAWMVMVYRQLRNLNVPMSPEVRGVFDRLLATDDEIREAREAAGSSAPLTTEPERMGLTPDEWGAYQRKREEAVAEGTRKLLREAMAPIVKAGTEEYQKEFTATEQEVREEFQRRPEFRARHELRFGVGFDGQPVSVPKLSRPIIEEKYGRGHIPLLPGATKDGRGHRYAVFARDGADPDFVAPLYGYATGEQLLDALERAPDFGEAVRDETNRRMWERHGDPLNDGGFADLATEAVHSSEHTDALELELRAVSEVAGMAPDLTAADARSIAARQISRMTVRDATATHRFLGAERRAANEKARYARTLGRVGEWVKASRRRIAAQAKNAETRKQLLAVDHRIEDANGTIDDYNGTVSKFVTAIRRQLMNAAYYGESRKVRQELERLQKVGKDLNRADSKTAKSIETDYKRAARAIAARYGLARPDATFDMAQWLGQLQWDDPVGYSDISKLVEDYTKNEAPSVKDMTVDEMHALSDALDTVLSTGRAAKTMEIEGRKVALDEATDDLFEVLDTRKSRYAPERNTSRLPKKEKALRTLLSWAAQLRRVESWARAMDDGKAGPFTRYIVRPVFDALGHYHVAKEEALTDLLDILNPARGRLYGRRIAAPELGDGEFVFDSKADLIHAILHTGNESNLAKLLLGNKWSAGYINQRQAISPTGKLRTAKDGTPILTKGELDRSQWDQFLNRMIAEGVVTPEDINLVNRIWALNEKLKRPAQSAHKQMFGFYFREIEPEGYDTAAGRLNGGYVPAIVDSDFVNDGVMRDGEKALQEQVAGFMTPTAGSGFTKSRVENYNENLKLDLSLLPSHMDQVLRFTYLDPTVRQVHRLIVRKDFSDELNRYDPTLISDMLVPWLQRVAQQSINVAGTTPGGRALHRFFDTIRQRAGISIMFANVVNVVQQVTGLSVAATVVKPSMLKDASIQFAKGPGEVRKQVFDLSPFMKDRVQNGAREMQMHVQEIVKKPTTVDEVNRWIAQHGYFMQQAVQNWIDVPVWLGAFNQSVAAGKSTDDAVFEADAAIRRTMVGMNPEDVSTYESGAGFKRLFTMFYTYFNGQANLLSERASVIARQYGWRGAPQFLYLYMMGVMVPAVGAQIIAEAARGGLGDDDDDGSYWDDLLSMFFGSQAQYFTAMLPIAGQLAQELMNRFNGNYFDDRLQPSPVISYADQAIGAGADVVSLARGKDVKASKAIGDGLTALSLATGLPANSLAKPLKYGANVAQGVAHPQSPLDILQGVLSGRDGTEE